MIFTRIKRGAVRTNLLIRYKFASIRKPIALRVARTSRMLSLTTLAAYTSLSIPMAHAAAPIIAAPEEPPSIVQVALAPAVNQHLSSSNPLIVASASLDVKVPQITKSRATLQEEELARQADEARQAAEKARQDEIARQNAAQAAALAEQQRILAVQASQGDTGNINDYIERYSSQNGVSSAIIRRVILCESNGNPRAINYNYTAGGGHPTGVAQFLPSTFYTNFRNAGLSGSPDIWNVKQQVEVMTWMAAHGQLYQWSCYRG